MEVKLFRVSHDFIINQCYLVYENNRGFLIDPAWDYALINDYLHHHNIFLTGVLLTHAHPDHTNLADVFAKYYNVPVFMSGKEIDESNFSCTHLQSIEHLREIELAGCTIKPLLTPGHTAGSTCYLIKGHLFSGDTIFIEGVGTCDMNRVDQLFDSVQYLKRIIPGDTIIWPGHSFGLAAGQSMDTLLKNNIYFQLNQRTQFISFRMRKNRPGPFNFK